MGYFTGTENQCIQETERCLRQLAKLEDDKCFARAAAKAESRRTQIQRSKLDWVCGECLNHNFNGRNVCNDHRCRAFRSSSIYEGTRAACQRESKHMKKKRYQRSRGRGRNSQSGFGGYSY